MRFGWYGFHAYLMLAMLGLLLPFNVSAQNIPANAPENVPFTYLWDTGTASSETLSAGAVSLKPGWVQLAEDDVTHPFSGDAVLSNDKIMVVLRKMGTGAELYSLMQNPPVLRAWLAPRIKEESETVALSTLTIAENNPGAVQLNAVFGSGQETMDMGFRLTTGEVSLEIHPGRMSEKLRIQAEVFYTIVPNYFGDDVVFSGDSWQGDTVLLPVEKYFLNALGNGDALMMCIWQSPGQDASLYFAQDKGKRAIHAAEIQCQPDQKIWIALLENANIWYAWNSLGDTPAWTPPFPSPWRVNRLKKGVQAISQPFTEAFLPSLHQEPFLIYTFDRDRTTPLTIFCPIDIMKNTLGVGPCQYILNAEVLAAEDHPPPDLVTEWVERQFERNRESRSQEQIQDQFKAMSALMTQSQERLRQYQDFARELQALCSKEMQDWPESSGVIQGLLDTLGGIEQSIAMEQDSMKHSEPVDRLAEKIIGLIGQKNAYPACQILCTSIRALAAEGNSALSKCRMKTRWLRQQCIMAAADHPPLVDFLNEIRKRAEQWLQKT